MKIYTKETLIAALKEIRDLNWVKSARPGNDGSVGNTLEDLLGIEENNLPIPNAAEWELKAQRKDSSSLLTLFHMEPSLTSLKLVPNLLLPNYGWPHKNAGEKYPNTEKSFRQTINAKNYSNRGFKVHVNRDEEKVEVSFNQQFITEENILWKQYVNEKIGLNELSPQPYWGFNDLFHKAGTKLHNCFYIQAARKRANGEEYFHYQDIFMLKELSKEKFIQAIEDGHVYVDFDARTGHNHGTKFRIKPSLIPSLYSEVIIL